MCQFYANILRKNLFYYMIEKEKGEKDVFKKTRIAWI